MSRVKVCGVTRDADREAVVAAGADAVGVITGVPVDTPREVASERAAELVAGVPPLVTSVLVTMPDSVQAAVALQREVAADAVQVHGSLDPDPLGELGERLDVPVVAAVAAERGRDDTASPGAYARVADALLVDSTGQQGGGGTGETHDWGRTREHCRRLDVPVVLAGGLTPANVTAAIEQVDPFAVDVASGVEREGGVKDHEAIPAFVRAVREAEPSPLGRTRAVGCPSKHEPERFTE